MLRREPPQIDPKAAALIVVDMQRAFLDPCGVMFVPGARDILPRVAKVVRMCRAAGVIVVWTRMSHDGPVGGGYCELFPQHFEPDGTPLLRCNTWDHEILPELGPRPEDLVVDKTTYSAFHGTDLEKQLRARGCDTVIICGIATNVCCESTARDAFALGFRVIVVSDATAAGNIEAHEASLRTLSLAFGWVIGSAELENLLRSTK